jgi:hemoglobin
MVADANAARRDQDLNATLYTIYRSYGDVRTTDDLLAMITASRDSEDRTVYEAAGGADGMFRLAHAWHERVMADDVVSHAFSHGFRADHTERLAAYWAEALGGPADYSASYGDETTVVQMHSGNGEHDEMDRRAIACFDQAMADIGLTADEPTARVLHDYFAWATTTTMGRYHRSADDVPHGLTLPKWSWDGLVAGTGPDDGSGAHRERDRCHAHAEGGPAGHQHRGDALRGELGGGQAVGAQPLPAVDQQPHGQHGEHARNRPGEPAGGAHPGVRVERDPGEPGDGRPHRPR